MPAALLFKVFLQLLKRNTGLYAHRTKSGVVADDAVHERKAEQNFHIANGHFGTKAPIAACADDI